MEKNFFLDFSFAKKTYSKFRPSYPNYIFDEILKRHKGNRDLAVDIGAGTGQASVPLTKFFKKVVAFDPSLGQLEQATKEIQNLEFRQGNAFYIDIENSSADLIVSAQAVHWFNDEKFYNEVKRVLKQDGLLALWGYALPEIENNQANDILKQFYWNTLAGYWDPGRTHLDDGYINIKPSFPNVERLNISMKNEMYLDSFIGYLSTWSGLNAYKKKNLDKEDPLIDVQKSLEHIIGNSGKLKLTFPIFMVFAKFCN